jgi:hypothetical protein
MEEKINLALAIVVRRSQGYPVLLSRASQVILGKVRTIHGRGAIGTHDGKRTVVALAPQHVGRS